MKCQGALLWMLALLIGLIPATVQADCGSGLATGNDCMTASELSISPTGEETLNPVSVELGVCYDVSRCAALAEDKCGNTGHGKNVKSQVDAEGTECSYTCADETKTVIACSEAVEVDLEMPEGAECAIKDPPDKGCQVVEHTVWVEGAGDDLYLYERDVTHMDVMSFEEGMNLLVDDFESITFMTVMHGRGPCRGNRRCARRANKSCKELNEGKALMTRVNIDHTTCSYTCEGGSHGTIVCS